MKKLIAVFRTEILPLLVILLLVTAARSSLADHYYVPSGSMEYSLMPGDHVVVDKTAYGIRLPYTKIHLTNTQGPAAGDVVTFDSPLDGILLIKRVVAVGGDRVSVTDGRLTVNGKPMEISPRENIEEFNNHEALLNLQQGGGPDITDVIVPPGKLLVMGDHRGDSIDGRFFGFINKNEVYGRAIGVYYRRGEGLVWKNL